MSGGPFSCSLSDATVQRATCSCHHSGGASGRRGGGALRGTQTRRRFHMRQWTQRLQPTFGPFTVLSQCDTIARDFTTVKRRPFFLSPYSVATWSRILNRASTKATRRLPQLPWRVCSGRGPRGGRAVAQRLAERNAAAAQASPEILKRPPPPLERKGGPLPDGFSCAATPPSRQRPQAVVTQAARI